MFKIELKLFTDFLRAYSLEEKPLLLGLSGGPDSMTLFHLFLASEHPFQVAHVNHGWRPESNKEADLLAQMCQKYGIQCHIHTLQLEGNNLEDRSRKARQTFFEKMCTQEKLEGVFLAHHADDQAETVLKRIFEGASLPKLQGLTPKTKIGNLTLYRPLLKVKKKEILEWLKEHEVSYFIDPTNADSRYLRSRMRTTLLPTLSEQFGKQIEMNLCRLGEAANELALFLQHLLDPFRKKVVKNETDVMLDFSQFPPQSSFIYKTVIRDFFESERIALPHTILEMILHHIQRNSTNKRLQIGGKNVEINRQLLMIKRLKNNCCGIGK